MDYLTKMLGVQVRYEENRAHTSLPNFILSRYEVKEVRIDEVKVAFIYPRGDLDPIDVVKKHLQQIEKDLSVRPVLVLDRATRRQREYLLRDHIPFIVNDRQIYLPFLAVYLQERCNAEKLNADRLMPVSQLLLLHYIYRGCETMMASEAAKALRLSPMSISRASKQLEEIGLLKSKRAGVGKILYSNRPPRVLFDEAKQYLLNPIKRIVYVPRTEINENLLISGYSALSKSSSLNPPKVVCFAADSVSKWAQISSPSLQNGDDQYAVELWRYDPRKLSSNDLVDPLSLALAFRDERDERVEEAVEEMLERTWKDICANNQ